LGRNKSHKLFSSHLNEAGSQFAANQHNLVIYLKSAASLFGKYIVVSRSPSAIHFPAGTKFSTFV